MQIWKWFEIFRNALLVWIYFYFFTNLFDIYFFFFLVISCLTFFFLGFFFFKFNFNAAWRKTHFLLFVKFFISFNIFFAFLNLQLESIPMKMKMMWKEMWRLLHAHLKIVGMLKKRFQRVRTRFQKGSFQKGRIQKGRAMMIPEVCILYLF